ncbi:YdeI family protein [Naasia sp. SYSU D00948]|uniref:YdeI/OmpD-associated family protein n=1 Tax=Naasia sp. SYSU D00948 TaxID=2817379 RepID=UPI001B301A5E|nr:YdeI/OmpD-associated family protein [Naasia sp. SYSU D00948]
MPPERATEEFPDEAAFEEWLARNHDTSPGIWLRLAKKGSGIASVTYDQALLVALCWGWIDGQKRPQDDRYWLQGFGPRTSRSPWSKRNRDFAEKLIADGRMQPSGLAEVERARADGRWERAYEGQRSAELPDDFLAAVRQDPDAERFLEQLDKANRFAIFYRIQEAKRPETRERRIRNFVEMLARGEKLY